MKIRYRLFSLLPLLLISWSCGDKPDVYSISIPNVKVDADSSITSFQMDLNAGTVQSVEGIPIGWNVDISDDVSWRSRVSATSTAGAATLSAEELKRLAFIVRRNETDTFKFAVSGSVTTSKSFENPKKTDLAQKDFALSAAP